jgi:2-keto-3-deoxy-L-rhamnonate aldolase RhmA
MNRLLLNVSLSAAFGIVTFQVLGQTPPPAPAPKPNADPYANNADAGKLRFPLAAPAGKDSGAMKTALPGAANAGPFDAAAWKYGPNFNAPADSKLWNPVKVKMMQGGKVTGGTVQVPGSRNVTDDGECGYDFIWTAMQHTRAVDRVARMCALVRAQLGLRDRGYSAYCSTKGALVIVVPTVDTVEEAQAARDWTFFPPLGKRSQGGGQAFDAAMWGSVPGGYRATINDNIVLILMIETLEGIKNANAIARVPGVTAVFAASGDLGNFSGYAQARRLKRLIVRYALRARRSRLCGPWHGAVVRTTCYRE